jgi:hypothetical protein
MTRAAAGQSGFCGYAHAVPAHGSAAAVIINLNIMFFYIGGVNFFHRVLMLADDDLKIY